MPVSLTRPVAPEPYALLPSVADLTVTSPDVAHGETLPAEFVADGGNLSPALTWSDFPSATRSFVHPKPAKITLWADAGSGLC